MEFGQKKFREIDLFDYTRFFALDFLNFLAHYDRIENYPDFNYFPLSL